MTLNKEPLISIILPAKNEGKNIKTTLQSLFSVQSGYPLEVIIIDDGSDDHSIAEISTYIQKKNVKLYQTNGVGPSRARNLGAFHASGSYFIFCDAHLLFENWWIDKLIQPLINDDTDVVAPAIADIQDPNRIGYGQTLDGYLRVVWNKKQPRLFYSPIIPGGCFAVSKKVFNEVGGFETGFRKWGHEDVELSIKLWLFGFRCSVLPNVTVQHLFRSKHPYIVRTYDVQYNQLRMAHLHFNDSRIKKIKHFIRDSKQLKHIDEQLLKEGIQEQREEYIEKRMHDDDWYFNKFRIDF